MDKTKNALRGKKGYTLIAAIFILLVVAMLAVAASTFVSSDSALAVKNYNALKAFYISNAGFEYYLKQLRADTDWTTPPLDTTKTFSGGDFSIATSAATRDAITVTVTGSITISGATYTRKTKTTVTREPLAYAQTYAVYFGSGSGGAGTTTLQNNASIIGDVFTNSNIVIDNGASISGDAYATGTITNNGTVIGTYEAGATPPDSVPSLDTSFYDGEIAIAEGGTPGGRTFNNETVSGKYYINGNVILKNAITISGSAEIVATGAVTVFNNATIGDNITVIAKGALNLGGNNITVGSNGLWYSGTSITLGKNNLQAGVGSGSGTSFLTPGDMTVNNNCTFYGLLYCGGTLSIGNNNYISGNVTAGNLSNVNNNSTIVCNPSAINYDLLTGIAGGDVSRVTLWDEVY